MFNLVVEEVFCLLFLCAVGSVFAGCLRVLSRSFEAGIRSYKFSKFECLVLLTGAVGIGCIGYGLLVEPFKLETTFVTLDSKKIAPSTGTVRIVHLSDLHCDGIKRTETRLPGVVKDLKPDLIVFTGDAANNPIGVDDFRDCMIELAKIAPTYAVYGNHDSRTGASWNVLGQLPVVRLESDSTVAIVRGTRLWIGGVGIDSETGMEKVLKSAPKEQYSVFLYHYPVGVKYASPHNIDLVCAGHTHGGQVCLPVWGALITQSIMGKEFESGLHKLGNTWCNISRGIGMTGLPVRFLCPPEVTVIDIKPQNSHYQPR